MSRPEIPPSCLDAAITRDGVEESEEHEKLSSDLASPTVISEFLNEEFPEAEHLMLGEWKSVRGSVLGSAHIKDGTVCQDFSYSQLVEIGANDSALILTCSDGAGSAKFSQLGSRITCMEMQKALRAVLLNLGAVECIEQEHMLSLFESLRSHLVSLAASINIDYRELACTLLVAVVGPNCSLFAQIGDGAIAVDRPNAAIGSEGLLSFEPGLSSEGLTVKQHVPYPQDKLQATEYEIVFWPDNGDYLNITTFITSDQLTQSLRIKHVNRRINQIALITDGLELLALNFREQTVHSPFFAPMFKQLEQAEDPATLVEPLRAFLNSNAINAKTDDDKTLMLAIRKNVNAIDENLN